MDKKCPKKTKLPPNEMGGRGVKNEMPFMTSCHIKGSSGRTTKKITIFNKKNHAYYIKSIPTIDISSIK